MDNFITEVSELGRYISNPDFAILKSFNTYQLPRIVTNLVSKDNAIVEILDKDANAINLIPEDYLTIRGEYELNVFIHDFTFKTLFPNTDIRLSNWFDRLGDGDDNLTPDGIQYFADNRTLLVSELATIYIDNVEILQNYARDKFLKYNNCLQHRLGRLERDRDACIVYQVIVASSSTVVCSFEIDQEFVDLITFRFRVAKCIIEKLRLEHSFVITRELSMNVSKIRSEITKLTIDDELTNGRIDKRLQEFALRDCDKDVVKECFNVAMTKARNYVDSRRKGIPLENSSSYYMRKFKDLQNSVERKENKWFNLPLVVPSIGEIDKGSSCVLEECEMTRLWSDALKAAKKIPEDLEYNTLLNLAYNNSTRKDFDKEHKRGIMNTIYFKLRDEESHALILFIFKF